MAERKSVNKYYPPDWDPSKGSINNYVGQHPLRDRAKKLSQGILVIRFEMPYNIWCGGCNSHIGMGVRYNAEKTKTGNYYTTPIYKFRMKCHLCDNYFEIQTDPKNHDYVILEGARRKEQRWDPKENEQIVPEDKATQKKMATDAMFKLEHGSDDVQRGKKAASSLSFLESRRDEWKDDYILNKMARNKFREEKKAIKVNKEADEALLSKSSLDIPLIQEKDEDKHLAGLMKYRTVDSYEEKQTQKRKEIESRPIFLSNKKSKTEVDSGGTSTLEILKKQIKNTSKLSSPFDRIKVNTLGSASALSQNSLGIRRKSLPSYASPVSEPGKSDVVDPHSGEPSTACVDDDVTLDLQPTKNSEVAVSVITKNESKECRDIDTDNHQSVRKQNCDLTSHLPTLSNITAECIGAKNKSSPDRDNNGFDVCKNVSSNANHSENNAEIDSALQNTVRVTEKVNSNCKTGLSLVSSYSDSDSSDATS